MAEDTLRRLELELRTAYESYVKGLTDKETYLMQKKSYEVMISGIKEKIEAIATKVYGADGVDYTTKANKEIKNLEAIGLGNIPICMAKNQYSLTDDAKKLGRPENFRITIRDITASAGAGFLVALTGDIMKMPGLPKVPSAEKIDVDADGVISGLF